MGKTELTLRQIEIRLLEIEEKLDKQKAAMAKLNKEKRELTAQLKKREAKKTKTPAVTKTSVKKAAPKAGKKEESVLEAILTQVAQEVLKSK